MKIINLSTKYIFVSLLASVMILLFFGQIQAATVVMDSANTVGTGSPFAVKVLVKTTQPLNAINLVLDIPRDLTFAGYSDGGSIINLWLEKPYQNGYNQVVASGIVPGGFSGDNIKLFDLFLKSDRAGLASISVNASSTLIKSSALGESDVLKWQPLKLQIVDGKTNPSLVTDDKESPEPFVPVFSKLPTDQGDRWAIVFTTVDKLSGIDHYEIFSSKKFIQPGEVSSIEISSFKKVQSPYMLTDDELSSYLYIKVVDRAGNYTVGYLGPKIHSWWQSPVGYILIAIISTIVLYVIYRKTIKRQNRK